MQEIKDQFLLERHRDFLAVALGLVTSEGLAALTMQRLADDLGCGVGTVYRHFPSKDALIAELQREALDVIFTSFRLSQAHLTELLERPPAVDEATAALARAVVATCFWIAAEATFPEEIDLCRRVFIDPTLHLPDDQLRNIVPAGLRLLDLARQLLEDAAEAGAVRDGPSMARAVVVIAGTTGVLMTSGLSRWDEELFDGRALATSMVRDLFVGWGADAARLAAADELADDLMALGRLVPAIR